MNKTVMYALMTNSLPEEKVEYCIELLDCLIIEHAASADYNKVVLPVARYAVGHLNMPLPPTKELAEIINLLYTTSYMMYTDMVKDCDDVEAEASMLMGKEIVKHFE